MPWLQARGIGFADVDESRAALPEVIRAIGTIGFDGFEASLLALPVEDHSHLRDIMASAGGLRLAGAHTGGPWCDPASRLRIAEVVGRAGTLRLLGCDRLVVSLFPRPAEPATVEQIRCAVGILALLGRACREEAGVRVLFHNHPWEMMDEAAFIDALMDGCAPDDVSLAPDLGWVAIGGMSPEAFISRFGSRMAYLHARGVSELGPRGRTLEAGLGIPSYDHVAESLEAVSFDGWLVAESEYREPWSGNNDPDASARLHLAGLTSALRGSH